MTDDRNNITGFGRVRNDRNLLPGDMTFGTDKYYLQSYSYGTGNLVLVISKNILFYFRN